MPHLILMRRVGESIRISGDVIVTVIGFQGAQVRIGIRAPREVHVLRAELPKTYPPRAGTPRPLPAHVAGVEVPRPPAITHRKRRLL